MSAQFSILRVRAATGVHKDDEVFMERYLDFRSYPKNLGLSEDIAGATLFNRTDDARRHGEVFMEHLKKTPGLSGLFVKKHPEAFIIVDYVHYEGKGALDMTARHSVVDTTILRR